MSEPFIGEIRMFPYGYAPEYWAYCDGQILDIQQYPTLFAVIQDIYGGDGYSTFALPNLMGRVPVCQGFGPTLVPHAPGELGGYEYIPLDISNLPTHNHALEAKAGRGSSDSTENNLVAGVNMKRGPRVSDIDAYKPNDGSLTPMNPYSLEAAGGNSQGRCDVHENRQPFLAVSFCIALEGLFPPRS